MNKSEDSDAVLAKEPKDIIKIHEHHFISIGNENETSLICPTCGLRYCQKCGKLVNNKMARYLTLEFLDFT